MTVNELRLILAPLDGDLEVLIKDVGLGLDPVSWAEQVLVDPGDENMSRMISDSGEPKFVIKGH